MKSVPFFFDADGGPYDTSASNMMHRDLLGTPVVTQIEPNEVLQVVLEALENYFTSTSKYYSKINPD
jgi:hypothetical protein